MCIRDRAGVKVQKAAVAEAEGHTAWVIITESAPRRDIDKALSEVANLEGSLPDRGIIPILYLRPENLS